MDNSRDQELVARCRRGDLQALEALVVEYQKPVYNAAYRILGNRDDAADATQATFLKAFENLDGYDPQYKFFSWIYRIAINESINQSKRIRRQEPLDESEPTADPGPDDEIAAGHLAREIQDGLMALSEDYRTVIVLRHFSDLSYRQISDILRSTSARSSSRARTSWPRPGRACGGGVSGCSAGCCATRSRHRISSASRRIA